MVVVADPVVVVAVVFVEVGVSLGGAGGFVVVVLEIDAGLGGDVGVVVDAHEFVRGRPRRHGLHAFGDVRRVHELTRPLAVGSATRRAVHRVVAKRPAALGQYVGIVVRPVDGIAVARVAVHRRVPIAFVADLLAQAFVVAVVVVLAHAAARVAEADVHALRPERHRVVLPDALVAVGEAVRPVVDDHAVGPQADRSEPGSAGVLGGLGIRGKLEHDALLRVRAGGTTRRPPAVAAFGAVGDAQADVGAELDDIAEGEHSRGPVGGVLIVVVPVEDRLGDFDDVARNRVGLHPHGVSVARYRQHVHFDEGVAVGDVGRGLQPRVDDPLAHWLRRVGHGDRDPVRGGGGAVADRHFEYQILAAIDHGRGERGICDRRVGEINRGARNLRPGIGDRIAVRIRRAGIELNVRALRNGLVHAGVRHRRRVRRVHGRVASAATTPAGDGEQGGQHGGKGLFHGRELHGG